MSLNKATYGDSGVLIPAVWLYLKVLDRILDLTGNYVQTLDVTKPAGSIWSFTTYLHLH